MKQQQLKMCELMGNFHNLCEIEGVNYYVIGPQLLSAVQGKGISGYEIDVAMRECDWRVIKESAHKEDIIEIESITDGGNLPGCYYRFVDTKTLLLDLDRYNVLAKPGIAINIHIIRTVRKKTRILGLLERGMEAISKRKWCKSRVVVTMCKALMGPKCFYSKVEQLLVTVAAKNLNNQTKLREPYSLARIYPKKIWNNRVKISIGDNEYYTLSNYKKYLSIRYGSKWETCKPHIFKETYKCIFSSDIPYKDYLDGIHQKGLLSRKFLKQVVEYTKEYKLYEKMHKTEKAGWDKTLFVAGDRFSLWKTYMPKKEYIMDLFQAQKYDEVELLLEEYIKVIEKYLTYNIVVCFDRDLLNIVKQLYIKNGLLGVADQIDQYVLEEDEEPIQVTW